MSTNPLSRSSSNAGLNVAAQPASQASSSSQGEQRPQQRLSPKTAMESQKRWNDGITTANNCLYISRLLRKEMQTLHDESIEFARGRFGDQPQEMTYQNFERLNKSVLDIHNFMESQVSSLLSETPMLDFVRNVEGIYNSELKDTDTDHKIDRMIDASNWNEAQWQYFHFESELLKRPMHFRSSLLRQRRLSDVLAYDPEQTRHRRYQLALDGVRREISLKNLGIYPKLLQRTASSTIVEFVFGVAKNNKDTKVANLFKFLFLEKNGQIEYINIYGPQEEWVWDNDFCYKNIYPCEPSRFKVYQKLTQQANRLMRLHFSNVGYWSSTSLLAVVSTFGKIREIFESKCVICRKHLRDFLPPTVFEIRSHIIPYHEMCKNP